MELACLAPSDNCCNFCKKINNMKIDYVNETVECVQIFILACLQVRKQGYLNFIGQF